MVPSITIRIGGMGGPMIPLIMVPVGRTKGGVIPPITLPYGRMEGYDLSQRRKDESFHPVGCGEK